ncbi:MAG: GntR family transcriptional regulator, partial [Acidimicrobiia bacterium]|nr:GntR family transcriptional regulator [Acidimicrobiia bacterium]
MPNGKPDTLHPLLSPIEGAGLAESVTARVRQAIRLGLIAPGQQLPSESALAGRLGVSTVTLREALATLREQGLVETRRGRNGGSFVIGPATSSEAELVERLRSTSVTALRDMGDEQLAVSATSARLAAVRASDSNINQMRRFVDQLKQASGRSEKARAHSRFHIEMSLASQSERLTRAQLRLQGESGELLWVRSSEPRESGEVAAALSGIVHAITDEHADRARAAAELLAEANTRWMIETHL